MTQQDDSAKDKTVVSNPLSNCNTAILGLPKYESIWNSRRRSAPRRMAAGRAHALRGDGPTSPWSAVASGEIKCTNRNNSQDINRRLRNCAAHSSSERCTEIIIATKLTRQYCKESSVLFLDSTLRIIELNFLSLPLCVQCIITILFMSASLTHPFHQLNIQLYL